MCVMLQVPAAEGLTVRVVNNINKKMEVKPRFLENFRNEGFADSFPYKQKVRQPPPSCDLSPIWRRSRLICCVNAP